MWFARSRTYTWGRDYAPEAGMGDAQFIRFGVLAGRRSDACLVGVKCLV